MKNTANYFTLGLENNAAGSLYECLAAIRESRNTNGYVREAKSRRLVAFWCDWRECVRPMFGANEVERATIRELANNAGNGKTL